MPSLTKAIFYSIAAAIAFVLASDIAPKFPLWAKAIFVIVGILTAAGAIAEGANWLVYVTTQRIEDVRRLETLTPTMEALRIMGRMSSQAQVELAMHFDLLGIEYSAWIGENGPQFTFQTGGFKIPYDFIETFFSLSNDRYLPAVRQWSEGSIEHKWADALTAFIVQRHYAMPAKGNKPAAWLFESGGTYSLRNRARRCFFGSGEIAENNVLEFEEE